MVAAIGAVAARVAVTLTATQAGLLARYVDLLFKWNRVSNLIGVRDVDDFIHRHLADCLSILPYVHGMTLADIGSGAGLPGLAIACARPEWRVALVEPRAKRARFLVHAGHTLGLSNIDVAAVRGEDWRPAFPIDTFVCRAFGSLAAFVAATATLQRPGCRLLAMKGEVPEAELAALDGGRYACQVHRLDVAGWRSRHLVEMVVRPAEC